jgi:predicted metal-dependent peptidase
MQDLDGEKGLIQLGIKRLHKSLMRLAILQPEVFALLSTADPIPDTSIRRMALVLREDRAVPALWFDPRWTATVKQKALEHLLIHEALHLMLLHPFREIPSQTPELWNLCTDLAVDSIMRYHFEGLKHSEEAGEGFADFTSLTERLGEDVYTAEKSYALLESMMSGSSKDRRFVKELLEAYEQAHRDDHGGWIPGHRISREQMLGLQQRFLGIGDTRKGFFGNVTQSMFSSILPQKGKVDWKKILNRLVMRYGTRKKYQEQLSTWKKVSRRTPYETPGRVRNSPAKRGGLLVALDTSGSMSDEILGEILGELNFLSRHTDFDWMQADCVEQQEPKPYKPILGGSAEIKGRGGTSFVPVMERATQKRYSAVILFTDGAGECTQTAPPNRVIWFLNDKTCNAPVEWGDQYYLNESPV